MIQFGLAVSPRNIFKVKALEGIHFLLEKALTWSVALTICAIVAEAAYKVGVFECLNNVSTVLRQHPFPLSQKLSQHFHFKTFIKFIAESPKMQKKAAC